MQTSADVLKGLREERLERVRAGVATRDGLARAVDDLR